MLDVLQNRRMLFVGTFHTHATKSDDTMKKNAGRYKVALKRAGNLILQEETEDWHLCIGQAYERLAHKYFQSTKVLKDEEYLKWIDEAVKYLHFYLTSSEHGLHKTEAWGIMGNAFTRPKNFTPAYTPVFVRENYGAEWHDPSLCYVKALSCDPGNAWILGRFGKLHFIRKRYQVALQVLNESIEVDGSVSNWFAYNVSVKVDFSYFLKYSLSTVRGSERNILARFTVT